MTKLIKKPKHIFKQVDENVVVNSQPQREAIVKVRNVDVQFGYTKYAIKAMKNVSFNIYRGEVLGLVGESGSGKSTTGNAIMGLVDRQNGTINVDEIDIKNKTKQMNSKFRKSFALKAQMIFQDPTNSLNPQKSIKNVIAEGLNNIDIKNVFAKQFDISTVTKLMAILKDKKQPAVVSQIKLKDIFKLISVSKLNQIYELIYVTCKKALIKFETTASRQAAIFLDLRSKERSYFLSQQNRSSIKKIKNHLIDTTIKSVGLSKQSLNRYPLEFSGGQQQRVSISRSVILRPSLIVADEPISALDVSIQAQVVNIFNKLKNELNLTILFIAHDLRMVEYISDRIAVMYKGRIIEIGSAAEISHNPIHPYTKSLLASVPSIDDTQKNLSAIRYDDKMHKYTSKNEPKWFKVSISDHFVYCDQKEAKEWAL